MRHSVRGALGGYKANPPHFLGVIGETRVSGRYHISTMIDSSVTQFPRIIIIILNQMGNQAYNQQYAINKNWINGRGSNVGGLIAQGHPPVLSDQQKHMLEQSNYIPQIYGQQVPASQRNSASRIGSGKHLTQPNVGTLRHSAVDTSAKQPPSRIKPDYFRGSTADMQQTSVSFLQQLPSVKLNIKPQICKSGSIIQKNQKKNVNFRLDSLTEQIDDIRSAFRAAQSKMSENFQTCFANDIQEMNEMIEKERQTKFKDKNKVIYLLKQKKHYHKLCMKFKDYDQKIKQFLLAFRKKDQIHQISQQELFAAMQLKGSVESVIASIEKDLPYKGWKAVLEQPGSKNYLSVVSSGMQDSEIVKKYTELEQSLTNPQILQQITNEQMVHSVTRRIGGDSTEDTAKKLIEGPAHYRSNQPLRGSRFPFPV